MSLVAAYSDSESENESEEDTNENQSKVCINSNEINKNDLSNHEGSSILSEKEKEETSQNFEIKDDDDWLDNNATNSICNSQSLFSTLPQPKSAESEIVEEVDDEFIKKVNKYESIDKPTDSLEISNDVEKPLNRPSLILPKPNKGRKRQTVKISIPTLEDIGTNSDSDEDESKIPPRNVATCKKKSTLFSMLPKPRHSVTVGTNKNKMFTQQVNRPLVPHTLTKKKETATSTKSNAKKVKQTNSLVGEFSDSDNDENDISDNFFSLGESKTQQDIPTTVSSVSTSNTADTLVVPNNKSISSSNTSKTAKPNTISVSSKNTTILQKSLSNVDNNLKTSKKKDLPSDKKLNDKGNSFFSSLYKSDPNKKDQKINTNRTSIKVDSNKSTLPKSTKTTITSKDNVTYENTTIPDKSVASDYGDVTGPYGDVTGPYGGVTGPYGGVTAPYGGVTAPYQGVTAAYENTREPNRSYENFTAGRSINQESTGKCYPTSQHFNYGYNTNKPNEELSETADTTAEVDYSNRPNEDLAIDEDALKRLQGPKRKRENINLIDIHGVDVSGDKEFLRNLTAEVPAELKMKHAEDQPSRVQKRKHQIHYLAHQAKERELQLQQAWADGRAMKQHTQSKYGF